MKAKRKADGRATPAGAVERELVGVLLKLRRPQHALLRDAAHARAAALRLKPGAKGVREDASALVRWLIDEWQKKGAPMPPSTWEG